MTKISKDVTFITKRKYKLEKMYYLIKNMMAVKKGGYSKLVKDIIKEPKVKT